MHKQHPFRMGQWQCFWIEGGQQGFEGGSDEIEGFMSGGEIRENKQGRMSEFVSGRMGTFLTGRDISHEHVLCDTKRERGTPRNTG